MAVFNSTDSGAADGIPLNDAYGTITQAANTVITRVIPPNPDGRSCVGSLQYEAAATAHTLSLMTTIDTVTASSDAASGQAVLPISRNPVTPDGTLVAANDWFIVQHEDGTWNAYMVSSVSGLNITMTANLTGKVLAGSRVHFMGAPADHSLRQFTMKASTTYKFDAGDFRIRMATGSAKNTPILVHSNNATNAGTLYHTSYYFD